MGGAVRNGHPLTVPSYDDIAALLRADGPFVSAYLESPSDQPNAGAELSTRWKTMRGSLATDGADAATLNAMDSLADHAGGDVLAMIAAQGKVLLRAHLPRVRGAGLARVGALPWVTPLLAAAEEQTAYVLVLADRTGADLHGLGATRWINSSVDGSQDEIERNAPGGWSQRRYQQRAIDSWKRNAAEVAAEVADLAERLAARLVLVGGDEHATVPLIDALPRPWSERVKRLEHATRAPGGDAAKIDDEIRRLVRTVRAEDDVAVLQKFREECGQRDKAADGPAEVIPALQAAMVDTLLVHDDEHDERMAWFGPTANQVAIDADDMDAMGVGEPKSGRLIDVAIRAAFGTGAMVRLAPATTLTGGLGAILRA